MPNREEELLQTAPNTGDVHLEFTGTGRSVGIGRTMHRGWASLRAEVTGMGYSSPVEILAQQWVEHHVPAKQIRDISAIAADVLGDEQEGVRWLSESNLATDNRAPIELMGEKDGFERVRNLLMRIEYGVLA